MQECFFSHMNVNATTPDPIFNVLNGAVSVYSFAYCSFTYSSISNKPAGYALRLNCQSGTTTVILAYCIFLLYITAAGGNAVFNVTGGGKTYSYLVYANGAPATLANKIAGATVTSMINVV